MKTRWAAKLYEVVIAVYPKDFRARYRNDMRDLFQDLVDDPEIRLHDLATLTLVDLLGGVAMHGRMFRRAVLFGCLVLDMWIIGRSFHLGLYLGVPVVATPFFVFVVAGYVGARSTHSFFGGMATAFLTGLVSALTVPGDFLLFHSFPFYDLWSFAFSMAMATAFCIAPAMLGVTIARFSDIQNRLRRSTVAFAKSWTISA